MVDFNLILKHYFYNDVATVKRRLDSGWARAEFDIVYEDMPCHLAQFGKDLASSKDDRAENITQTLRLHYSPDYDIWEGDMIEVLHKGQIFILFAGVTFKYSTHSETTLFRRREGVGNEWESSGKELKKLPKS